MHTAGIPSSIDYLRFLRLTKKPWYLRQGLPRRSGFVNLMFLFLWLVAAGSAGGEESRETTRIEMDPMVITGTFFPADTEKSSASLTIIREEQIIEKQAGSVTELLRQVEGLHIDQAGGRGSISSVYLRGSDPNHTVVLIDGMKVNDPTNSRGGSFDFSTLSVDSIARIEIVRGPLSSIYGSDAIAGAIQILTHQGSIDPVTRFKLSGWPFGYHRALLETRGTLNRFDYAISGSYLDNGEPVEGSGYISTVAGANLGFRLTDGATVRSVFRYADSRMESFPDDSGGPEFAIIRQTENRSAEEFTMATTLSQSLFSHWTTDLQIGFYDRNEEIHSPGIAPGIRNPIPPNSADNHLRRYHTTQKNLIKVTHQLDLIFGGEIQIENGKSKSHFLIQEIPVPTEFELARNLWAVFLETRYSPLDHIRVDAGARLDHPEDFNSRISPRIGLTFSIPGTRTRLHGSWGRGFKLPSFFALGHPIVGNPELDPERSRSIELGVRQTFRNRRATIEIVYFSNIIEDGIDFQENPIPVLVNREEITAKGLEVAVKMMPVSKITLSSHLSYVKTDIKGTDEELRNRPKWRGGVTLRWQPVSALVFNLDYLYVGRLLDSSVPTGDQTLNPYNRTNLSITWTAGPNWEYFFTVQNLMDSSYEEAIGFPAPGIHARAGIQVTL